MNKRILIFGATGRTGQLIVEYALAKGYSITALVRNPEKLTITSERLTIYKGSPTSLEDVQKAMAGCNYVISALSALSVKDSFSFKLITPPKTLEKSIGNAIKAMNEYGIRRIVTLSSIGVGDSYSYAPWFMRWVIRLTNFKIVFADHNEQELLIQQSALDWIIARPVGLTNTTNQGKLVVSYHATPSPFKISRMLVAKFMVDQLNQDVFLYKAPILSES
ncbi:NAD(P)H-binding protein [Cytophagaceae bacterium DM2B3-1]|uniref:NAD(P)H-binding protein n=1 Tax=Xanthocytophaga flava TaxID=3048013 RepID=A0ABT7CU45_9BACT|nr:NAD(P)H-binding protein [Xanthocytophaga flavus]MDJ1497284.1 NAD(P)H-binding protein [Xanthocytophaga flavus]